MKNKYSGLSASATSPTSLPAEQPPAKASSKKRFGKKLYIAIAAIATIAVLLVAVSTLTQDLNPQPTNVTASGTQFKLHIAYSYVGKYTGNASYTDSAFGQMYLVSQYPSAVVLNITRIPGIQVASCEAEIEVYGVHIATNTGQVENHAYFVGTNYNSSFSGSELSYLDPHINDIVDKSIYSEVTGNFDFNWTANTSILTHRIGSAGSYSSILSNLGLWSAGKPNSISVSVYRIGYMTISSGSVSVYKDATNNTITTVRLGKYGDGFLYNTLVPATKLPQTDLFNPIP
ncbi:MAG: hypothetical protein ABSA75_13230 [Candidatus Bathyarchaeia archaeon]